MCPFLQIALSLAVDPCLREKSPRPVKGRGLELSLYHLLHHTIICVLFNGRKPALLNRLSNFQHLQLRSDIQIILTRTGLPPSPARYTFRKNSTVFVIVFPIYALL